MYTLHNLDRGSSCKANRENPSKVKVEIESMPIRGKECECLSAPINPLGW